MPYLEDKLKTMLDGFQKEPESGGELNYKFTMIAIEYLRKQGLRYIRINDIVGALECCKLEFYRKVAGPYEDTAIARNGDVYPKISSL